MTESRRLWREHGPWAVAALIWLPLLLHAVHALLDEGNDFTILHAASARWIAGEPLYDGTYMYPPFFALLLAPLSLLPVVPAGIAWAVAKIGLFHYSARVFWPEDQLPRELRRWLIGLSPLLVFRFVESDLVTGNTNIVLLAGIALALRGLERGRALAAGAVLAVVAAVKLSPVYLILAIGVAGERRAALAGLLLLPCWLVGTAAITREGWSTPTAFLHTSKTVFSVDASPEELDRPGALPGQSLRPILHRLTRPAEFTSHDGATRVRVNLLSLSPRSSEWLYRGIALGLALAGLFACRGRSTRWTVAWSLAVMLLISPYSRKAHFVLLLPAMITVAVAARFAVCHRCRLRVSLSLSWALGQLSTRGLWGKVLAEQLLAVGVIGGAALALLPGLWWCRSPRVGRDVLGRSDPREELPELRRES